jgi:hypothetical protein
VIVTGLMAVTLVLWPFSVRQARRMLALSLAEYMDGLRGPALATCSMVVALMLLRDATADMGDAAELAVLVASGAMCLRRSARCSCRAAT